MKNVLTIPSIVAGSKNGGGASGTTNYNDLTNKPAIDGVVLTSNTTKADLGITSDTDNNGIKGDYASKYGIINAQNGLITYASDSKEVTVKAGIQLLMPGSETKTQIGSDIKYTINSTSDVTLFLADGEIKEAEGVYYQTEEPENGQEAYLAWFNPELGKWQFKSNDDGNVWKTPIKAGPLADVHLSDAGVIRVDYVGYRVLNDQIFALKSDLPEGNVYTNKNLISGKNILLTPVMVSGGIDSNTQACWHFDENLLDEVVGLAIPNGELTTTHKFGTKGFSFTGVSSTGKLITLNKTKSFTIDFWIYFTEANKNMTWDGNFEGYGAQSLFNVEQNRVYTAYGYNEGEYVTLASPLTINTWHHVAFVHDITTKVVTTYVNGSKIYSHATTYPADFNLCNFNGTRPWYIDELRVSSAVEYTEDFIPATEQYSKAVATEKVSINNALTKTSQLTNDSGFITDVPVATTTVAGKMKADGTTITVTEDGTISAASSAPDNMMTTNTFQEISARKYFNEQIDFNSVLRASSIISTNNRSLISDTGSAAQVGDYTTPVIVSSSNFNINTVNPNSGGVGSATLNGKQIATIDDITTVSSGTTSVNGKSGAVVLTGADIQTTYTANPEATETTTTDVNSALTTVCEDIHNVLTNVPTGAELMSTTIYPYQAPLATDATLADVITKVNTILAIMSERGVMKKNG